MNTFVYTKTSCLAVLTIVMLAIISCSKGTNSAGNDNTVTPKSSPTLSTSNASGITATSVTSGGTITSDGGAAITARGVCWSTTANPTIANSKTSDGTGTGSFTSTVTGITLTGNTTYYIRAYATNSIGTSYGNDILVSAATSGTIPTVVITNGTAFSGAIVISASITADGSLYYWSPLPISAMGICWSTTANPTIANNKTSDTTTGGGNFVSSISNLTVNTTYYVRAYATNKFGTAYSDQMTFTTGYQIGQNYGGGLIFYIDASKVHGLIVTKEDQSASAQWDNTSGGNWVSPGAFSTTDGATNTTKIITTLGNGNNAAAICRACRDGGFTDWFLPALNQLTAIQLTATKLYPNLNTPGSFGGNEYWSSTETSNDVTSAVYMNLSGGNAANDFKNNTHAVRAIRAF